MNFLMSILVAGAASIGYAAAAHGADLPTTKDTPPVAPPTLASCASFQQFFTTACPLTYYGVTLYGTIDAGVGYEKFGAPFNPNFTPGVDYQILKAGRPNIYALSPNGLSQSNIGVKVREEIAPGWSIVGLAETGFDPYSLRLANSPASMVDNNTTLLRDQTANGDSSRAGQIFNSQVYAGLSGATFGTLTFGRQNTLDLDGVNAYDPMGGSYAFSPIGFNGLTAGSGDTGTARSNSAFKYRVSVGPVRAAAMVQVGGFAQGNGATGLYQFQLGGDFLGFSVDGIFSRMNDAVSLSPFPTATSLGAPPTPDTLKALISDNTSVMLLAKYTWNQFKFFGGYEHIGYQNPSSEFAKPGDILTALGGYPAQNQGAKFFTTKVLQVMWVGAKYAVTSDVDVGIAYYHYDQNNFKAEAGSESCSDSSHPFCSGTFDAASAMVDWRFADKFDAYAGAMFSEVNNGLANGFQTGGHVNIDPTVGLRFRF